MTEEGRCNCTYGKLHNPIRGWMCGLTTWTGETDFSKGLTCREMYGSAECRKHAHRYVRTIHYKAVPLYPGDFVETPNDYDEVVT